MAIGTNDRILKFEDTAANIGDSSVAIANDAWSLSTDVLEWTNEDDSELVSLVMDCSYTTAPNANGVITIHPRMNEIVSTNNEPDIDDDFVPRSIGGFVVKNVTGAQRLFAGPFLLPVWKSQQKITFFFYNGSGQQIDAGWVPYVRSIAPGPHA